MLCFICLTDITISDFENNDYTFFQDREIHLKCTPTHTSHNCHTCNEIYQYEYINESSELEYYCKSCLNLKQICFICLKKITLSDFANNEYSYNNSFITHLECNIEHTNECNIEHTNECNTCYNNFNDNDLYKIIINDYKFTYYCTNCIDFQKICFKCNKGLYKHCIYCGKHTHWCTNKCKLTNDPHITFEYSDYCDWCL